MNLHTRIACALAVATASISSPASAAGLPETGTYSAHFGWTFSGEVQELGAERTIYAGVVAGVIFNDTGKGFLHKARVDCPIFNDVNQGRANATGSCVVTDVDGDKIFMVWKCTGVMPACPGDERFVGGTGKYAGISGSSIFQGNFIGATGGGWSDWKGEYQLP